jgi:hypothetical protein
MLIDNVEYIDAATCTWARMVYPGPGNGLVNHQLPHQGICQTTVRIIHG